MPDRTGSQDASAPPGRPGPAAGSARDAASIWLRPALSGRGPAPAFDRERLADAGVRLADAEGLAAVTMRAVARSLGSAPASLYRYVTTREELLELMIDRAVGEVRFDGLGSGDWLDDLRTLAHRSREVQLRHPWLPEATASGSPLGPHTVAYLEHALAALAPVPVPARTKLEAVGVLQSVVGSLTRAERARRTDGGTLARWQRADREFLARTVAAGEHPHVAAAVTAAGGGAPQHGEDEAGAAAGEGEAGTAAGEDGAGTAAGAGDEDPAQIFDRIVTRVLSGLLGPEGRG
ncbi:TetR/AcrR family transcriptional regulator [Streptomyces sp. NRRL F-5053]|uniref:TetR/AcrR family transcriptional regulator n=1 Tax=Streptomyces sp. NRRL F-5053 TaxID=1463854 RepID=UPI00068EFE51|nr:TetR/AcrR family transcriptional regulator [Streptomyces sp. NRRL F-5053]